MRSFIIAAAAAACFGLGAGPASAESGFTLVPAQHPRDVWQISFGAAPQTAVAPMQFRLDEAVAGAVEPAADAGQTARRRPVAVEYSDGYRLRQKIHKYASYAMLPLFGAEFAVGQSLYNSSANADSRRGAHAALGAAIGTLFGINTVTGAWNMFGEGRKDPNGRTLRLVHGLLMMAADVGFLATAASGPNSESERHNLTFESDKVTHRNIAVASMGIGTVGYLIMLFGNR
jgi:hypothetical protein